MSKLPFFVCNMKQVSKDIDCYNFTVAEIIKWRCLGEKSVFSFIFLRFWLIVSYKLSQRIGGLEIPFMNAGERKFVHRRCCLVLKKFQLMGLSFLHKFLTGSNLIWINTKFLKQKRGDLIYALFL